MSIEDMLKEMAQYMQAKQIDITIDRNHMEGCYWCVRLSNRHFHIFQIYRTELYDAILEAYKYVKERVAVNAMSRP